MAITYDPAKREWTLCECGLDFDDADAMFAGPTFDQEDGRRDYGETRVFTIGLMRKANEREKARYRGKLTTYR